MADNFDLHPNQLDFFNNLCEEIITEKPGNTTERIKCPASGYVIKGMVNMTSEQLDFLKSLTEEKDRIFQIEKTEKAFALMEKASIQYARALEEAGHQNDAVQIYTELFAKNNTMPLSVRKLTASRNYISFLTDTAIREGLPEIAEQTASAFLAEQIQLTNQLSDSKEKSVATLNSIIFLNILADIEIRLNKFVLAKQYLLSAEKICLSISPDESNLKDHLYRVYDLLCNIAKAEDDFLSFEKYHNRKCLFESAAPLFVKTRGNSSPQGKPRIYLAAHPEDIDRYLSLLCEEIFQTQNCAIYYHHSGANELSRELLSDTLSDVQLILVPVTTAFLTGHSFARETIYPFALRHHIPILPILMEPGLDKLFSETMNRIGQGYGDIQFLDRTQTDPFVLSYSEKLKRRLNDILLDDELTQKIRASFDAYVFLSYRKKDRKYAKDLMRLIHSISYCRDIAIWYDEFLIPGENWQDFISDALANSLCIILAVTPSIIEPGNYVICSEYPAAKSMQKDIFPIELLPTDPEALCRLFPELEPVIPSNDKQLISDALKTSVQRIIKKNTDSPEHTFLMGLAYLEGIDVERDPDQALSRITQAAEEGLPEAMKKLSIMYRDGDTVARDPETQIQWLFRYKDICKIAYRQNKSLSLGLDLIAACADLIQALAANLKISEAIEACLEFDQISKDLWDSYEVTEIFSLEQLIFQMIASLYEQQGDLTSAEEWMKKCLHISHNIGKDLSDLEQLSIGGIYGKLGTIAKSNGDGCSAQFWFAKSIGTLEKAHQIQPDDEGISTTLSSYYGFLGNIYNDCGHFIDAQSCYMNAINISEAQLSENESETAKISLAYCFCDMGTFMLGQANIEKARHWYTEGFSIADSLAKESGSILSRQLLCECCAYQGSLKKYEGNLQDALYWYQKALQIAKCLLDDTGSIMARENVSHQHTDLSTVYMRLHKYDEAVHCQTKSLEQDQIVAESGSSPENIKNLLIGYINMGSTLLEIGEHVQAKFYFKKALNLYPTLTFPQDDPQIMQILCKLYTNLGFFYTNEKNFPKALESLRQARDIADKYIQCKKTPDALSCMVDVCGKTAEFFLKKDDLKEAAAWYKKAITYSDLLLKQSCNITACDRLILYTYQTGLTLAGNGNYEESETYVQQAIKLLKECSDKTPKYEFMVDQETAQALLNDINHAKNQAV